jgi:hypothetical protein
MTKRWSSTRSDLTQTKKAASKRRRKGTFEQPYIDGAVVDPDFDAIEEAEFEVRGEFGRSEDYG